MNATIGDFFGTNLEQEVLDEVVLNGDIAEKGTGTYSLPSPFRTSDFEWIEVQWCRANTGEIIDIDTVPARLINSDQGTIYCTFFDGVTHSIASAYFPKDSTTWGVQAFTSSLRVRSVVGYKRRISRVGIDELMSAMSLPNLIANADLTSNPINQRNFNGNWSSLAVGAYGYDQWMKVSATHMGYVIEEGKYRPNAKHTLTKDDAVIGEFMSPASGHWAVAVPFSNSGKFDLYAGQFKRPWHPVLGGEERCLRYYEKSIISYRAFTIGDQYGAYYTKDLVSKYFKLPSLSILSAGTGNGMLSVVIGTHIVIRLVNPAQTNTFIGVDDFIFALDASITLAELNGQIVTIG